MSLAKPGLGAKGHDFGALEQLLPATRQGRGANRLDSCTNGKPLPATRQGRGANVIDSCANGARLQCAKQDLGTNGLDSRAAGKSHQCRKADSGPEMRSRTPEDEFSAWLAKYGPVERKIIEDRARRLANRENRRRAKARAFGGLCEATEGLAVVWRREGWSLREMLRWADGDVLTLSALAKWMRHDATKTIDRIRCRLRRPVYYASEKARRLALAEERRRIGGRRTTNPCPTKESILDAWIHRRDSHEAAVRFGSMIHDLECYVDNSLLRDEYGAIIGRNGGVKAWLYENIPALHLRYGTVMRYKAMAKKLKQITNLPDPVPAEAVLGEMPHETAEEAQIDIPDANMTAGKGERRGGASRATAGNDAKAGTRNAVQTDKAYGNESGAGFPADGQTANAPSLAIVRARAVWLEVVNGIRGSVEALMDRIDALTDPSRVEDAAMLLEWKAKYAGEITERAKTSWWRRMLKTRAV